MLYYEVNKKNDFEYSFSVNADEDSKWQNNLVHFTNALPLCSVYIINRFPTFQNGVNFKNVAKDTCDNFKNVTEGSNVDICIYDPKTDIMTTGKATPVIVTTRHIHNCHFYFNDTIIAFRVTQQNAFRKKINFAKSVFDSECSHPDDPYCVISNDVDIAEKSIIDAYNKINRYLLHDFTKLSDVAFEMAITGKSKVRI